MQILHPRTGLQKVGTRLLGTLARWDVGPTRFLYLIYIRSLSSLPRLGCNHCFSRALIWQKVRNGVWQYKVPSDQGSSHWNRIRCQASPSKVYDVEAGLLVPCPGAPSPPPLNAQRILVRAPMGKPHSLKHFGVWSPERAILTQFTWRDGTPLLNTSTAHLRVLQERQRFTEHTALSKWTVKLSCEIPANIWTNTWLGYRGASENMFYWQLAYRVIATQHWRNPSKPHTDPTTWCTRCPAVVREEIDHCIWSCHLSRQCWQWGEDLMQTASPRHEGRIRLQPAHIFIAHPIPAEWQVPDRFWQVLKAILCWQIWKNRNAHYLAGKQADARKVIHKSWPRFSLYLHKDRRFLAQQF